MIFSSGVVALLSWHDALVYLKDIDMLKKYLQVASLLVPAINTATDMGYRTRFVWF